MDYELKHDADGYPYIELRYQDRPAIIHAAAVKRTLLEEFGVVYLGDEFEEVVEPITLPPDPSQARGETRLFGFTADPEIVQIVRQELVESA